MIVTSTELKANLGKYLDMANTQDITITRNGKAVLKLINPNRDKIKTLKSLVGIVPKHVNTDLDSIKAERLFKE